MLYLIIFNFVFCLSFKNTGALTGFYTNSFDKVVSQSQYQIVYPQKISNDGAFVSYDIPHYYNMESMESRPRRTLGDMEGSNKDEIHFYVPISGEKQHLKLWPNWNFMASGLVVERRDARDVENVNKAKISKISTRQCYYSGEIVGKPNSSVALSTCYGLAGFIREPAGDEYLIEPLKNTKVEKGKEHPHIIYKRSGKKDRHESSNCLTNGKAKDALNERLEWESMFGEHTRKEMAGTNLNELILDESKRAPVQVSMKDKLAQNLMSFNGDLPQIGNSYDKINTKNQIKNIIDQQHGKFQQTKVFQETPNYENMPKNDKALKSNMFSVENKFKHKLSKGEINMGSIKLPDVNFKSADQLNQGVKVDFENYGFDSDTNFVSANGNFDHKRSKRSKRNLDEINNKIAASISKGDAVNNGVSGFFVGNTQTNKQNMEIFKSNSSANNSVKTRSSDSENKIYITNEEGKQNEKLKGCASSVLIRSQNNEEVQKKEIDKVNKRDYFEKVNQNSVINMPVVNAKTITEDNAENAFVKENLKGSQDLNGNNLSESLIQTDIKGSSELGSLKTNENENNKRDIHLDASEKSWQSNESQNKLRIKSEKASKKCCNEELTGKPLGKVSDTNFQIISSENLQSSDKGINKKQENEKLVEPSIKEIDSNKVKKEIAFDINNVQSAYKLAAVDNSKKSPNIQNNEKYVQLDNFYLTNSNVRSESQKNPNLSNEYQNLVVVDKEKNKNTMEGNNNFDIENLGVAPLKLVNNKQEFEDLTKATNKETIVNIGQEPQVSKDKTNTQIVIHIEAPEGTVSEVNLKGNGEFNDDISRKDNLAPLNAKKSNIVEESFSNSVNAVSSPIKDTAEELIKRGIAIKGTMNQRDNLYSNSEQPIYIENQKSHEKNTIPLESHEQQINENGNTLKIKRDDSIHVASANEPQVNNPQNSKANTNPKRDELFCKGQSCLDIKAFVLSEDVSTVSPLNATLNSKSIVTANIIDNNNSTENITAKVVEKRQAWDECAGETTEKPIVCFDFPNKMFNIEIMVTVDFKVYKLHEDGDIENFMLTIINMVSTNFYDKSVGVNLSIYLVRMIILTTCIKELDSDRFNPEELLENFCTWQYLINPSSDDHPHHHDLAIFVTRMDKCEGQTLGVSYMTSVCRPDKSCLVCVDEGLLLANTITHQIGHTLGAGHDESENSGCSETTPDGIPYHMSPTITETSSTWSVCSRDALIQFIKTQGSWCLSDLPVDKQFHNPLILPGQIYSAPQQCKLNFHMNSVPCAVGLFCDKLYCQVTEKLCATKGDPPADGTFCAADMWCFHKQCVHVGRRPGAINGEWGPWTEWSLCTRSCGGGISSSYRICNRPKPENGGRFCVGDRIRYKMCATKACTGFTESFRDMQCKKTEDKPFRGRFHNWMQYQGYFLNLQCALVCQNRKGDIVMRSPIVADGTPCKPGTKNVCIQGFCRNVGCDWVIDSNAKDDACGVCQGNGTECRILQGVFLEEMSGKGEIEFLRLPQGSGMIFVREMAPSANVLVVSGSLNRVFYLNGLGSEVNMPGDVTFGNVHGVYEVRSGMERIFIKGPIEEELVFYMRFREQNRGVQYQYALPEVDPTYSPRYLWQYLDWEPCTEPCSGGSQRAHAKCVEDRGGVVDDQYCTESSRPMDVIRPCNDFPCQAKWWVSVWSDCICMGSTSLMFRSVLCMRAVDESGTRSEIVKESECAGTKKPSTQKSCNTSEDDECTFKRSVLQDISARSQRDLRRAVNSESAFSALSPIPAETSEVDNQDLELLSEHSSDLKEANKHPILNKNQKKPVKAQTNKNINAKEADSKVKIKFSDNELPHDDKNKVSKLKESNNFNIADSSKLNNGKDYKSDFGNEKELSSPTKSKQISKLKSKVDVSLRGDSKISRNSENSKQLDDSNDDIKDDPKVDDKCTDTTPCESTTEAICQTQPPESTLEQTTCRATCPAHPHKKTTCCKPLPKKFGTKSQETTTLRPVVVKLDEVNMNNLALTIVPLDFPSLKRLPQTDPEYINLGNIGQFNVGDEANATVLTGQEALDFLEYARNNASEEPVILHEDMHSN